MFLIFPQEDIKGRGEIRVLTCSIRYPESIYIMMITLTKRIQNYENPNALHQSPSALREGHTLSDKVQARG